MKLYKVVLKDVIRRRKRVAYATLGVVIGTMTMVGILTITLAILIAVIATLYLAFRATQIRVADSFRSL